jgi:hypothetical protein
MLTAGMSSRAVAREFNVNFSTINRPQRHCREYGSTSNRSHNRRPRVTTPAQEIVWALPPGQLIKRRSNKALLWGKTQCDWLGLARLYFGSLYSGKKKYVNLLELPGFLYKLVIKFDLIFI